MVTVYDVEKEEANESTWDEEKPFFSEQEQETRIKFPSEQEQVPKEQEHVRCKEEHEQHYRTCTRVKTIGEIVLY